LFQNQIHSTVIEQSQMAHLQNQCFNSLFFPIVGRSVFTLLIIAPHAAIDLVMSISVLSTVVQN